MKKDTILIVDDEDEIREQLKWAFAEDYEVLMAANAQAAIRVVQRENPNLVALDIGLSSRDGELNGLDLLEQIVEHDPKVKVIMITGNDRRDTALKAVRLGACDYYQKPIDIDELRISIRRALYIQKLERENETLSRKLEDKKGFRDILGSCPQMLAIYDVIKKVSTTDATVLIEGESGTGKELVARAIHHQSPRKENPFVPINCGAIPENLLESELFGHERGAFTGAHIRRQGKFEVAEGGTIFLDEVGELSLALQVKILRFLQEREIERVGGRESIELNVRIIAATNKNLDEEMEREAFRPDLYYRLSVITVSLPPLRERGDDVILLANSFLRKFSQECNQKVKRFSSESLAKLREHSWPGNIRELENKVKRAIIMAQGSSITPDDLGLNDEFTKGARALREAKEELEKKCLIDALKQNNGNISRAARKLGVSRTSLYDLLNKHGVDRDRFK